MRKSNPTKLWIQFGAIAFIIVLILMLYATYVYLCYVEDNGIAEDEANINLLMDVAEVMLSPSMSVPVTGELVGTLFYYQVKLWYVYAGFAVTVYLVAIGGKPKNDYRGVEKGSAQWEDKYALRACCISRKNIEKSRNETKTR